MFFFLSLSVSSFSVLTKLSPASVSVESMMEGSLVYLFIYFLPVFVTFFNPPVTLRGSQSKKNIYPPNTMGLKKKKRRRFLKVKGSSACLKEENRMNVVCNKTGCIFLSSHLGVSLKLYQWRREDDGEKERKKGKEEKSLLLQWGGFPSRLPLTTKLVIVLKFTMHTFRIHLKKNPKQNTKNNPKQTRIEKHKHKGIIIK